MYALRKRFEDNSKEIDHICVLLQEGFRDIRDLGIICSYNARVTDAGHLFVWIIINLGSFFCILHTYTVGPRFSGLLGPEKVPDNRKKILVLDYQDRSIARIY